MKFDENALNKVAKDVTREWATKAQAVLDDVAGTSAGHDVGTRLPGRS